MTPNTINSFKVNLFMKMDKNLPPVVYSMWIHLENVLQSICKFPSYQCTHLLTITKILARVPYFSAQIE